MSPHEKEGNKGMPTPKQKLIHNPIPTSLFVVCLCINIIRPSVDGLCRDGPSEISRDPRTKRLQTQPKWLGWL